MDDLYSNPVNISSFSISFSETCINIESKVQNTFVIAVVVVYSFSRHCSSINRRINPFL